MNKNIKPIFTIEQINLKEQPTIIVKWSGDMQFAGDNCCAICGFKIRGNHSYAVHLSVNGYLLPTDQHTNDYDITQGFFAVGSECRKQLPATHTIKDER